jgi:hypothetical protein
MKVQKLKRKEGGTVRSIINICRGNFETLKVEESIKDLIEKVRNQGLFCERI